MSSALTIASTGLHSAVRQFEQAARDIVATGTLARQADQSSSDSVNSGAETANTGRTAGAPPQVSGLAFSNGDFVSPLVDMKQAEISYKALVKVLQAADRLEQAAINMVR